MSENSRDWTGCRPVSILDQGIPHYFSEPFWSLPNQPEIEELTKQVKELVALLKQPSSLLITGTEAEELFKRLGELKNVD